MLAKFFLLILMSCMYCDCIVMLSWNSNKVIMLVTCSLQFGPFRRLVKRLGV